VSEDGKTVVVNIDDPVLSDLDNLRVLYDGVEISLADDYEDVLDPFNDDGEAEFLLLFGTEDVQVLVSIPSFSVHRITIAQLPTVPSSTIPPLLLLGLIGIGLASVLIIVIWRYLSIPRTGASY